MKILSYIILGIALCCLSSTTCCYDYDEAVITFFNNKSESVFVQFSYSYQDRKSSEQDVIISKWAPPYSMLGYGLSLTEDELFQRCDKLQILFLYSEGETNDTTIMELTRDQLKYRNWMVVYPPSE